MKLIEIYQSKKDEDVTAKIESREEKYGTVLLEYVSGPNAGKTVSITLSTLKRWWKLVDTKEEVGNFEDTIDYSQVNTKYPEPKVQKYIPKPQSVIEYEAKKNKKFNANLPTFDEIIEDIGSICIKINNNSSYVKLKDKSTIWRKQGAIDIYAAEDLWGKLTDAGLSSKPNKDKDRPFAFKITSSAEYEKVLEVLKNE